MLLSQRIVDGFDSFSALVSGANPSPRASYCSEARIAERKHYQYVTRSASR